VSLPAIQEDWDLTALGLKIQDPDITIVRFGELCWLLGQLHEAVRFAIGDAIIAGEALFGESAYQCFEEMNLSDEAKREYVRVALRVPRSRRRKGVSWSHHRAVAALEPQEQKVWLKKVSDEGMSHHALRDELRNGEAPRSSDTCRCCGRTLL
jgi:hypothetical protein